MNPFTVKCDLVIGRRKTGGLFFWSFQWNMPRNKFLSCRFPHGSTTHTDHISIRHCPKGRGGLW
jgi:hypothetical protein